MGAARVWLLWGLFVLGSFLLTGCDLEGAGDTAVLNANSAIPPTVRYTFEYATDGDPVEVISEEEDDLAAILSENGFRRDDVASARIDSVVVERLSASTFGYVTGMDLHLGPSSRAPRVAGGTFQSSQESARLRVTTSTVTDVVKQGPTKAFARFDTEEADSIPEVDRVRATVYFEIEVKGV